MKSLQSHIVWSIGLLFERSKVLEMAVYSKKKNEILGSRQWKQKKVLNSKKNHSNYVLRQFLLKGVMSQ